MSNNTKALKSKIISSRPQEGSLVHRVEPETLGQRLDFKRTVKKKKTVPAAIKSRLPIQGQVA